MNETLEGQNTQQPYYESSHPDLMERGMVIIGEWAGSSAFAAYAIDKIGLDWRFSFLAGAAITAALEKFKN